MRKVLSLLLVSILILFALVGCGADDKGTAEDTTKDVVAEKNITEPEEPAKIKITSEGGYGYEKKINSIRKRKKY